jgi:hypothetical protein
MFSMEARKIRIGEAAAAIGTTPKAVRHWITRYASKGVKPSAAQTGTWLEFSWGDVAALAITKYLIDLGMPAPMAFTHAMAIVEKRWPGLFDEGNPHWSLNSSTDVIDFNLGPGFHALGCDTWWGVSAIEGESLTSRFQRRLDAVADKNFPARAIVNVYVGLIVIDAFRALVKMEHIAPVPSTRDEASSGAERELGNE